MSIILTCGFQPVNLSIFRNKSQRKGERLVKSYHVSNVKEIVHDNLRKLTGCVLRETPGAHSTRKNENVYDAEITLNTDRTIFDTNCSCKAGRGYCKHAAAVCIYVNLENTCSKTDQPMIWNRPPQEQLDKYHKGCKMEQIFPSEERNREKDVHFFFYDDLENVTVELKQERSIFSKIIEKEDCSKTEKEKLLEERKEFEKYKRPFLKKLYDLQSNETVKEYGLMGCDITENNKIKIYRDKSFYSNEYFKKNISVDEEKWLNICFTSVGQSESSTWFKERFIRITASSKAHKIRTRKNLGTLTEQLLKEKRYSYMIPALRYGLETERKAKSSFQEMTGLVVEDVGLIISVKQPYLACSPDGVIYDGENYALLEIKCPFTCKDSAVVDFEENKVFVNYLQFNDAGEIHLKKSDVYYTQIQVSMYVLGVDTCHFFVYSPVNQVHILITKDEDLLSLLIPKIEAFYFNFFLPVIEKRSVMP